MQDARMPFNFSGQDFSHTFTANKWVVDLSQSIIRSGPLMRSLPLASHVILLKW